MVSSSRWAASSTSSWSSRSEDSWECEQPQKTAEVGRKKGERKRAERLSVDDERELAKRVLEDLEGLYFDEDSEDESEDDEFDSGSEWGSDKSSRGRAGGKSACGMTLEELTVAVNAAIEYHLPTKSVADNDSVKHSPCKPNERSSRCSNERQSRPSSRHQRKGLSRESFRGGESELEFFQEMLERKERQFYAMKAAAEKKEIQDRQLQETAQSALANVIQQQQTTTYLRDQATETEECPHYEKFDASFEIAEFETPLHSASQSVSSGYDRVPSELPVAVGPTLADLAKSRRRIQRTPPRKSSSSSRSSWSSSSSSTYHAHQSEHSSISKRSSRSSSSNSSACSSRTSSRSEASNKSAATSSKRSTHSNHGDTYQPSGLSREPSIDTSSEWHNTVPERSQIDGGELEATPSPADPQVPHSPALVSWELDLSNFTP